MKSQKISRKDWKHYDKEDYDYEISCMNSTAEKIDNMMETAEEISFNKFKSVIGEEKIKQLLSQYTWGRDEGLKLKDDYYVSYYRGIYKNKPAYIIQHSAIEYIFTGESEVSK